MTRQGVRHFSYVDNEKSLFILRWQKLIFKIQDLRQELVFSGQEFSHLQILIINKANIYKVEYYRERKEMDLNKSISINLREHPNSWSYKKFFKFDQFLILK